MTLANLFTRLVHSGFFLWRWQKNVTFGNNPHMFDDLKSNILQAISDINSHDLRKVSFNLVEDFTIATGTGLPVSHKSSPQCPLCLPDRL
ncbi:hypothetical protein TNCV_4673521 [Trichonephila clavipes]|nr:hypothetical protein TNCV_4673521 [Trichonephila clavipes]